MNADPLIDYRPWLEESIAPIVRAWSPQVVTDRYKQATEQFFERTHSDEASQRYARACPVPGIHHSLYRLREVSVSSGTTLLAGIHFRGLATEFPFVGVFAQTRWLSASELRAAHVTLMTEFRVFSPQASWWWSPAGRELELPTARTDQYVVMGSLEQIARTPTAPLPPEWRLRRLDSAAEVADVFAQLYGSFHDARPDLKEAVPATDATALEDCAQESGLYGCFLDEELVGLVAAKPDRQYGVNAWLMWDIVLARRYCGQGLAPLLQRAVLDRLDRSRGPFVVGTIDARNSPSLRTALRVGRKVVGSWTFVSN